MINRTNSISSVLLGWLMVVCAWAGSITVSPASPTINQNVQYTFQITLGTTGITPGTATIYFDSTAFSFTNSSGITGCSNALSSSTLYSCYASSSSSISFRWTGSMPEGDSPLFLSVNPIKNPSFVNNYTVSFGYVPDSGATFGSVSTNINGLQPDVLTSCGMSFSPNYTNTLSTITFTIINKNSIPSGGSLQLTFNGYTPTSSNITINALTSSTFVSTSTASAIISGVNYFFGSFFQSTVTAGTTLTFSIGSITAPPTTASSLYSITIVTSATNTYLTKVDQSTCTITNIATFPTASLTAVPSSTMRVGSTNTLLFINFIAPATINFATDTIQVTVDSSSQSSFAIAYLGITVTTNVTSTGMPGSSITGGVTFPTTTNTETIASGTAVRINSGLFSTATINSGTKTVSVSFSRSGGTYSSNTATLTVSPNTLTAATLSVLSNTVGISTTYTFFLTLRNPLGVGSAVRITLPSSVSIATGTCSASVICSTVNAVSSTILCSASTSQIILVSNITNTILGSG